MAELDGRRVAAVLAADAQVEVRTGLAAQLRRPSRPACPRPSGPGARTDRTRRSCCRSSSSRNLPASSRLKPKVIWVRSLVPKQKNSASLAISSAVRAARGISIMVPTSYFMSTPASAMSLSAVATTTSLTNFELLDLADQRDHDLRDDRCTPRLLGDVDGGVDDSGGLHLGDLRIGDGQTAAAVAHHRVELVQAVDDVVQLSQR